MKSSNRSMQTFKCVVSMSQATRYFLVSFVPLIAALISLLVCLSCVFSKKNNVVDIIPSTCFTLIFLIFSFLVYKTELVHYLTIIKISDYGIICTRLGRLIKQISWSSTVQIKATKFTTKQAERFYEPLILVSGHIISEEERKNALKLIGLKNDFFVLPYNEKTLSAIPEEYRPEYVYNLDEPLNLQD